VGSLTILQHLLTASNTARRIHPSVLQPAEMHREPSGDATAMPSFDTPAPITVAAHVEAGFNPPHRRDCDRHVVEVMPRNPTRTRPPGGRADRGDLRQRTTLTALKRKYQKFAAQAGTVDITVEMPTASVVEWPAAGPRSRRGPARRGAGEDLDRRHPAGTTTVRSG